MAEIINDYGKYKRKIDRHVFAMYWYNIATLTEIKEVAERGEFPAPFLFQDEDERHFNHDIAKECRRRLDEIGT